MLSEVTSLKPRLIKPSIVVTGCSLPFMFHNVQYCYNSSCVLVQHHVVQNHVIKKNKKNPRGDFKNLSHWLLKLHSSQLVCVKYCIIQTAFNYSWTALWPFHVNKTLKADLTVWCYQHDYHIQTLVTTELYVRSCGIYRL